MKMLKKIVFVLALAFLASCGSESGAAGDNYDRTAMLANWADNIIIPSYANYFSAVDELKYWSDRFTLSPSGGELTSLRTALHEAYLAWQRVEMFEIGKAEELGFQGYLNTFPADVVLIESLISSGNYNLELPSRRSQQGFPAVDYLVNGLAESDAEIIAIYGDPKYLTFLSDVVNRIHELSVLVNTDWNRGYRDTFVNNSGSSATASVNKLTNDFIFHFEKHLRAAKIGVPAGVFNTTNSAAVEAYYQNDISKELLNASLEASQAFFNGDHFEGGASGQGLADYLDYVREIQGGDDIAKEINDQYEAINTTSAGLSDSFSDQIESDNTLMLQTYDALQENVILMKTDMIQKLNIRVDYVDADGD